MCGDVFILNSVEYFDTHGGLANSCLNIAVVDAFYFKVMLIFIVRRLWQKLVTQNQLITCKLGIRPRFIFVHVALVASGRI